MQYVRPFPPKSAPSHHAPEHNWLSAKKQQSSDTSLVAGDDVVEDADQQITNLSKELELVDNDENTSAEEGKRERVLKRMSTIISGDTSRAA